jgi:hypothetical protein
MDKQVKGPNFVPTVLAWVATRHLGHKSINIKPSAYRVVPDVWDAVVFGRRHVLPAMVLDLNRDIVTAGFELPKEYIPGKKKRFFCVPTNG